jgi:hypothetical protein
MRKLFCSFAVVLTVVFGTLAANADTQKFYENGPGGPQTLSITDGSNGNYQSWLSGASGFASGSCAICSVTATFDTTVRGITYTETVGLRDIFGWWSQQSFNCARVEVPEESSLFELMAAGLALMLILPRARKLQRAARA